MVAGLGVMDFSRLPEILPRVRKDAVPILDSIPTTPERDLHAMKTPVTSSVILLIVVMILLVAALGCGVISNEQPSESPMKIGLLLNFTGSPEASADRQRAFDLAIQHVNEGGGVLGMPVEGVAADATQDPGADRVEARRGFVEEVFVRGFGNGFLGAEVENGQSDVQPQRAACAFSPMPSRKDQPKYLLFRNLRL